MHELFKYFKPQSLFSTAFIPYIAYYIHKDIGCDFVNALAIASVVVFQSISACNCLDMTCVIACMLQTFLDVMLLLAAVHAISFFKALLYASHLFKILVMLHYMVTWYEDM